MNTFYTSKEIKPRGWLKRQLEIQAGGLSGNLDKIWPDIRDSAWIGGSCDGWERVPCWLDGFIPLAYLLENEDMIARAKYYIDTIIAAQKPDGWICPCPDDQRSEYDSWAVLLMSKVLTVYYDCSEDDRIPAVLYRMMKNYYELLLHEKIKLYNWGKFRWFEGFFALNFLASRFHEEWIPALAKILRDQGADYLSFSDRWKRPLNQWALETHIVNLTMMLKSEAVSCDLLGEEYHDIAETAHQILSEYNGTAVGLYTGDECLAGSSPIQGTELCSVVEQMFSFEQLYARTGERKWAERLEKIALNALPAALTDDMWAHQYNQMSNQIACQRFPGKAIFRTNGEEAHLFGLEPNYGCCTANFNQGFPKLTLAVYMHNGDMIENVLPFPSELRDGGIKITLDTEYPFKNSLHYSISADRDFLFRIRIPSFAKNLRVNGEPKPTSDLSFSVPKDSHSEISVTFDTVPCFETRSNSLITAKCGSLVFSLPIEFDAKKYEYEKNGVERKFPYCDYEYLPVSSWNYAFSSDQLAVKYNNVSDIPFSSKNPPVVLQAKVKKIDWGYEDGYETVCAKRPHSTLPIGEEEKIELYPYGCAKLRLTELPTTSGFPDGVRSAL